MKARIPVSIMLLVAQLVAALAAPTGVSRAAAPRTVITPIVVTPASSDWTFVNDNGTVGGYSAGFQNGPGTPPLGVGSYQMALSSTTAGILIGAAKYQGTKLSDIGALKYSTYTNQSPQAIAFQVNYDPDVTTVESSTWYGRLIYEPYINGTVTNAAWQTWDMIDGGSGKWWASANGNSLVDDDCPQSAPCTWTKLTTDFPNIGIRNDSLSMIQFKAGSNWNGFSGNIDNFSITIGSTTDTYDFELPSTVYVNGSWTGTTPGTDPDGAGPATSFGADSFATISDGVAAVASGGTVQVAAGTYVENVTISTPLTLAGANRSTTIIQPAVSNPNCGDNTIGASLCSGGSNLILVQANNVHIHDFTLDGNNPALTSGQVFGGSDIDARNGIITNHNLGTFNGLEVDYVTIQNIFLRGIYASSGGTFNFHHNTVTNVQATYYSIAMFAYGGGPGYFTNNTVSDANDAISANHSGGIEFVGNTVTNSGSGVHTDNAGDGGGSADLIQDNTISNCNTSAGGYGIFVFVPYIAPTVNHNTITNCKYGLSDWGQGAVVTPLFTDNTVNGSNLSGSIGLRVSTDLTDIYGALFQDVTAEFTGNHITNNDTGVLLTMDAAHALDVTFHGNQIDGNAAGVSLGGTPGTFTNDFAHNWWGTGLGPTAADNTYGAGNSVVASINYRPWCATSACLAYLPAVNGKSFDGDLQADPAVFEKLTGNWFVVGSNSGFFTPALSFGNSAGYTPVPGDYDGDRELDAAVYEKATGNWFTVGSKAGFFTPALNFGGGTYVPVPGDYDGDGKTDAAVFDTSTGNWFVVGTTDGFFSPALNFGAGSNYVPVPGDYDGDGKTDPAVFDTTTGNWFAVGSTRGFFMPALNFGAGSNYRPVPGDYDGDGKTDPAVFEKSSGNWFVVGSTSGFYAPALNFGSGTSYTPQAADFDGDGKVDPAVFENATGNWFVVGSTRGFFMPALGFGNSSSYEVVVSAFK